MTLASLFVFCIAVLCACFVYCIGFWSISLTVDVCHTWTAVPAVMTWLLDGFQWIFSPNISSGKIVGSGYNCVLLGITVSVCSWTISICLWQKKKESSVLCGALHPTHKFNWKTIAGINCINFAYCMSKKKGKWNQLLYFCRIFFQVSCRVYLAWHVSCSLSWWRIMHQVYLVCLVSVCCSSSRMICFLCLMPNMVHL